MTEYVAVASLPTPVRDALKSVGYGRKDIAVSAASSVVLSSSSGAGQRAFVVLVNLTSGASVRTNGSWGGANMFNPTNAVDLDNNAYPLPADGVAITGSIGGGSPVYARLHVPASMVAGILPPAVAELSEAERNALYCFKAFKGGAYRKDELARRNVTDAVVDSLVLSGMLTRNKAGATAITTAGKNAVGDYRGY